MITLFTTPKPFRGRIGVAQRNALRSWKSLWPDVEIIVFGPEEGAAEACAEFGLQHVPNVETNEFGTKRIDWIFKQAQQIAHHDFLCYINCDIILLSDFARAFERVRQSHSRFLMVGRRWDMDINDAYANFSQESQTRLRIIAEKTGVQRSGDAVDYFLFTRGLFSVMPALVIGRVWWDHWLVWNACSQGADVVDVSSQAWAVHQNHDYGYHPQGATGVWNDLQAITNYHNAGGRWHLYTIDDATHILDVEGEHSNGWRYFAPYWRVMRPMVMPVWHGFLDVTRPVRNLLGLRQKIKPPLATR